MIFSLVTWLDPYEAAKIAVRLLEEAIIRLDYMNSKALEVCTVYGLMIFCQ
jgi:hypothetical protein